LPGALTAGAICTLLQLAYNELGILRLKYVSRYPSPVQPLHHPPPVAVVPQKHTLERILITLGMRSLSDEEYLRKLKTTRDIHLKRIEELELERQLEAEKPE
jgi:hypothetical protein